MDSYLMTWNRNNWRWHTLHTDAEKTKAGETVEEPWSCGVTKRIQPGDRLFLLKQGDLPRGIMATGFATSIVEEVPHWNEERAARGDKANQVRAIWDTILDPLTEALLPTSPCHVEGCKPVKWSTQSSGISIPTEIAALMEHLWSRHVASVRPAFPALDIEPKDVEEDAFPEGREQYRLHRSYERNPHLIEAAKAAALRRSGRLACVVCSFDFGLTYGTAGDGFIECHHTIPVSELGEHGSSRLQDIVLVCSNCHRMLHHRRPWLSTTELKTLLKTATPQP